MSLDSLNSLQQLLQTRESAAGIQQDNLEQVQSAIQELGTSEAQKTDQTFLEKAKAKYEVALHKATIERIESKLQREQNALAVSGVIAAGVSIMAAGDFMWNLAKDIGGHQSLGDGNTGKRVRDIDPNGAKHQEVAKKGSAGKDHYFSATNPNGTQTVQLISQNGNGSINSNIRSATIDSSDVRTKLNDQGGLFEGGKLNKKKALELGLVGTDGNVTQKAVDLGIVDSSNNIDISKIDSFDKLMAVDQKAATALFSEKSHHVLKAEAEGIMNLAEGSGVVSPNLVQDALIADGKMGRSTEFFKGGSIVKLGDTASNTLNSAVGGLISLADTVVPFFQAMLAAKEKVQNTIIELEAARQKFAAAQKQLNAIQRLIDNPGEEGVGNLKGS